MSHPKSKQISCRWMVLTRKINWWLSPLLVFQVNIFCSRAQTCSSTYTQSPVLKKPPENAGSKRRYSSWIYWTKTECCLHGVKANESRKK